MTSERIDLRERTFEFSRRIIRLFVALPSSVVAQVLGKQLLRSGTSVGANYREAFRSRSRAEFVAKMGDCLKELEEALYWIDLIIAEAILDKARVENLRSETSELVAIFVASLKSARNKSEPSTS